MRIYLAGGESHAASPTYKYLIEKDSNRFFSYFYDRPTSKALDILHDNGGIDGLITIDSGAHSFFGYAGISVVPSDNNKRGEMPDPEAYFDRYLEWVSKYYDKFSYFVELDLQQLLGMKTIWKWRHRIKAEGLLDKCILVHHSCNETKHLKEIMDFTACGYFGFEGKQEGRFKLPYKKLLKECYMNGFRVHGFALTSQKVINAYPFYSVDSSSWLACLRYGVLYKFKDGKMYQIKSDKASFFKHNLDLDLHRKSRGVEFDNYKLKVCEKAFKELEVYMTRVWKRRGIDYNNKRFHKYD